MNVLDLLASVITSYDRHMGENIVIKHVISLRSHQVVDLFRQECEWRMRRPFFLFQCTPKINRRGVKALSISEISTKVSVIKVLWNIYKKGLF